MSTYFSPINQKEHEKGKAGQDVPDYCKNCNQSFMVHTNGKCQK